MDVKQLAQQKMKETLDHLAKELRSLRTGRAHSGLLDGVAVEVYGSEMRLKEIANVTTPESRQILVTPFDRNNAAAIAKGIERANLGFFGVLEGGMVRVNIPSMDENMRKEMVKLCQKRCEEAKVGIRNARREVNELVRKKKSAHEISEDEAKRLEKEIQEQTDNFCRQADKVAEEKEKEIMTV